MKRFFQVCVGMVCGCVFALAPLPGAGKPRRKGAGGPAPSPVGGGGWRHGTMFGRKLIANGWGFFPRTSIPSKPGRRSRGTFVANPCARFGVHVLLHGYLRRGKKPTATPMIRKDVQREEPGRKLVGVCEEVRGKTAAAAIKAKGDQKA